MAPRPQRARDRAHHCVIEKLFSWPGLGSLLVDSVTLRDIPVVQGAILVIVLFFLFANTLVDVLCALIDPRIKYS
jgi:glutathione transport system permease protein